MYSPRVATPSPAVTQFVPRKSVPTPAVPAIVAHPAACVGVMRPDGSGRFAVRFMAASLRTSINWLNEFAEAAHKKVPPSAEAKQVGSSGPDVIKYPAVVVATTRPLSRLLESSPYTAPHSKGEHSVRRGAGGGDQEGAVSEAGASALVDARECPSRTAGTIRLPSATGTRARRLAFLRISERVP